MDKRQYTELRTQLDLRQKTLPLLSFYCVDIALTLTTILLVHLDLEPLGVPLLATIMFRNFSLMHDGTHGAISKHKILNNIVGTLSGWVSLLPFSAWKEVHLRHHLWSGNIHKDPVMALRLSLPMASPLMQKAVRYTWKAWIPLLAVLQYSLFWKLALHVALKRKSLPSLFGAITPLLGWGLLLTLTPADLSLKLFLPSLFLYLISVEVVNFPHHLQLPLLEKEEKLPAWQQDETARTCLYPRWFAHFFVLNFNYHVEHHMFPDAPWYTLNEIHEKLRSNYAGPKYVDSNISWTIENRSRDIMEVITESERLKKAA